MASGNDYEREVTFEIVEFVGVIASYPTGWKKELNLVSWNGGHAKYDIRDWDPSHEHMSRGVTLHEKELKRIVELLRDRRPFSINSGENKACSCETAGDTCSCELQ